MRYANPFPKLFFLNKKSDGGKSFRMSGIFFNLLCMSFKSRSCQELTVYRIPNFANEMVSALFGLQRALEKVLTTPQRNDAPTNLKKRDRDRFDLHGFRD